MNGKFLGVVIGAVVAIMLVGSLLMPIINEQTTTTELAPAEGAYGYMRYQSSPETESYAYLWVQYQSDPAGFKIQWGMPPTLNHTILLSDIPDGKMILYADSHFIAYIEDGKYHYYSPDGTVPTYTSDETPSVASLPVESNFSGTIKVTVVSNGIKYTASTTESVTVTNLPAYYYISDPTGDYANFVGDNPPTMDTPSVSVAGMYIGPKMAETTTSTPGAPIYLAIPIVILVALLTAVAFVAFRRDY